MFALASGVGGLVVAFAAGTFSFLSPCVLPLVPGYLSLMSGVTTSDLAVATKTELRTVLRASLLFVFGFTVVFTALGLGASAIGVFLNDHQRGFNVVAGVLVIVMGLFIAGVVSPRVMQQERRFRVAPSRLGVFAAPVMGMAFALGWTPCIGPVLGSVLSIAATQGTPGRGMALLIAYSLGLGVPFVAAAVGFGRFAGAFDWVKRHYRVINLVSGLLLVGFGVLLLTDRVSRLSSLLVRFMKAIGLVRLTRV